MIREFKVKASKRIGSVSRSLLLCVSILGLTACETLPSHRFLTKPEQAALGTVDGVLAVPVREPGVTITPSGQPGAGGLIGVFVFAVADGIRSARAQSESVPIIAALQGFDFQAELLAALKARLEALIDVKVVVRPTIIAGGNPADAQRAYAESTDPSFLLMESNYKLVSGDLWLGLSMALYPKSEELKKLRPKPNDKQPFDKGNALFYISPVVIKKDVTAANIRASVEDGIAQLARTAATVLGNAK